MTRIHRHQRRAAFTLVEMMVASALIIFMMWIIATAFEKGLTSFRVLKTAGDMQEKLRGAATAIRRDLTRPHFEKVDSGGENLSDQRFDDPAWEPPIQGYFRIYQQGTGAIDGPDADDPSMNHYRSPAGPTEPIGHVLQFTNKLRGIRRDQYYVIDTKDLNGDAIYGGSDAVGNGRLSRFNFPIYNRRVVYPIQASSGVGINSNVDGATSIFTTLWAEVCYFVRPNGETAGTTPLYNLYRQQNLLVTDLPDSVPYASGTSPRPVEIEAADPNYLEISAWRTAIAGPVQVNGPKSATVPLRRTGAHPSQPHGPYFNLINSQNEIPRLIDRLGGNTNHPLAASDLLLTNVTDFEIKVLWEPAPGGNPPWLGINPPAQTPGNPDYPFDRLPPSGNTAFPQATERIFDTWSKRPSANAIEDFTNWQSGPKQIPLRIRVRAIQIELRIWDVKSQQSRQITIIQDV
jgi:hypothetical protein